jgi:hypothetical protein
MVNYRVVPQQHVRRKSIKSRAPKNKGGDRLIFAVKHHILLNVHSSDPRSARQMCGGFWGLRRYGRCKHPLKIFGNGSRSPGSPCTGRNPLIEFVEFGRFAVERGHGGLVNQTSWLYSLLWNRPTMEVPRRREVKGQEAYASSNQCAPGQSSTARTPPMVGRGFSRAPERLLCQCDQLSIPV